MVKNAEAVVGSEGDVATGVVLRRVLHRLCGGCRGFLQGGCGGGVVDTWRWDGAAYRAMPATPTAGGARTSLFVPELDRLFVAERAGLLGSEGAIRIYAPVGTR